MRSALKASVAGLACCVSATAGAMSCGLPVRLENRTDGQATVLVKSFYGVALARPGRFDFADETTVPLGGTGRFTRIHEFVVAPHAGADVSVRTLCADVAGRSHYINWRSSTASGEPASGQLDLVTDAAHIEIP
ncbi:MAG TPA: hypothetical protein VLK29_10285 [Luteimonas sp.]|nr:hypothetical protein [Luteimonas sp.]